jgi:hypothetical protein
LKEQREQRDDQQLNGQHEGHVSDEFAEENIPAVARDEQQLLQAIIRLFGLKGAA